MIPRCTSLHLRLALLLCLVLVPSAAPARAGGSIQGAPAAARTAAARMAAASTAVATTAILPTAPPAVSADSHATAASAPSAAQATLPSIPDARVRAAALHFGLPYEPLRRALDGLDMLYARRYAEAKELFRRLEVEYPAQAVGPFGLVLLAQAQMAENLDFRQERAHNRAVQETLARTDAALDRGDARVFNLFIRAGARGMNGIYRYRRSQIVGALQDGWCALQDLEKARALDPSFADPNIGFGVYNYWRTALTRKYWYLPKFPDRRQEGLRQLELARDQGLFTPTLARLAIAFTFIEDRRPKEALAVVQELQSMHPGNIITLRLMGQMHARLRQDALARAAYERVLTIDPRNVLTYYDLGSLELQRGNNLYKARDYLTQFLAREPDNSYETSGRIRLGDTYWLLGDRAKAQACWDAAAKKDPDHRMAKLRMDGIRPKARPGLIGLAPDLAQKGT